MKSIVYPFIFVLFCILFSVSCSSTDTYIEEEICDEVHQTRWWVSPYPSCIPRSSDSRGEIFWWCPPGSPDPRNPNPRIVLTPPTAHNTLRLRVVSLGWNICCWSQMPILVKGYFRNNARTGGGSAQSTLSQLAPPDRGASGKRRNKNNVPNQFYKWRATD